jgi:hypothetical protein
LKTIGAVGHRSRAILKKDLLAGMGEIGEQTQK